MSHYPAPHKFVFKCTSGYAYMTWLRRKNKKNTISLIKRIAIIQVSLLNYFEPNYVSS